MLRFASLVFRHALTFTSLHFSLANVAYQPNLFPLQSKTFFKWKYRNAKQMATHILQFRLNLWLQRLPLARLKASILSNRSWHFTLPPDSCIFSPQRAHLKSLHLSPRALPNILEVSISWERVLGLKETKVSFQVDPYSNADGKLLPSVGKAPKTHLEREASEESKRSENRLLKKRTLWGWYWCLVFIRVAYFIVSINSPITAGVSKPEIHKNQCLKQRIVAFPKYFISGKLALTLCFTSALSYFLFVFFRYTPATHLHLSLYSTMTFRVHWHIASRYAK